MRALLKIDQEYGQEKQVIKMGEEGAELASAVLKHLNTPHGLIWDHLVEEMVDVHLMISQVVGCYFSEYDEERFKDLRNMKLTRQLGRILENV